MEVTVVEVINQMEVVIPTIIAATLLLTSTIKGVFKITSDLANNIISWVVAIATAIIWVVSGQLSFGLGGWDYAVASVCAFITGLAANKIYTWDAIKTLLDAITNLLGGDAYIEKKEKTRIKEAEKKAIRNAQR